MKKMLWIAALAAVLGACTTGNHVADADHQSLDTAGLIERVNGIYQGAFEQYSLMDSLRKAGENDITMANLDSLYCSQDWNEWVGRVNEFDKKNSEGMVGFFDADYWIMGQDWQDLGVSDVAVTAMTDSTATVALNLHNCGSVTPVRLEMVKEADEWRIDDFISNEPAIDWKASMKEYLTEKK